MVCIGVSNPEMLRETNYTALKRVRAKNQLQEAALQLHLVLSELEETVGGSETETSRPSDRFDAT